MTRLSRRALHVAVVAAFFGCVAMRWYGQPVDGIWISFGTCVGYVAGNWSAIAAALCRCRCAWCSKRPLEDKKC